MTYVYYVYSLHGLKTKLVIGVGYIECFQLLFAAVPLCYLYFPVGFISRRKSSAVVLLSYKS